VVLIVGKQFGLILLYPVFNVKFKENLSTAFL
jgi:hypothetical protein